MTRKTIYELPEEATVVISCGTKTPILDWLEDPNYKMTSNINNIWIRVATEEELEWGDKGLVELSLEEVLDYNSYQNLEKQSFDYRGEFLLYKGPKESYATHPHVENINNISFELISIPLDNPDENTIFPLPLEVEYVLVKVWVSQDQKAVYAAFYPVTDEASEVYPPLPEGSLFLEAEEQHHSTKFFATRGKFQIGSSFLNYTGEQIDEVEVRKIETSNDFSITKLASDTEQVYIHNRTGNGHLVIHYGDSQKLTVPIEKEWWTIRVSIKGRKALIEVLAE